MRSLTADELSRLQGHVAETLLDTCVLKVPAAGANGEPVQSFSDSEETACGFDFSEPQEVMEGNQHTISDATVRLPLDVTVNGEYRIRLTHRLGVELETPEVYRILGDPERGHGVYVCKVRRVVGNSAS